MNSASFTDPWTKTASAGTFSSNPPLRSSRTTTEWPLPSRWVATCAPRKPAPPVTSEFGMAVSVPLMPGSCQSPSLAPQEHLKGEQRPQRFAMVAGAGVMVGDQLIHRSSHQVLLDPRVGGSEGRADVAPQILAEPAVERYAEAPLRALEDLLRHDVGHGGFQHPLQREAAGLEPRRQAGGQLQEFDVEQGGAQLQRVGHARAIRLHEQIVDQIGPKVEIEQPVERVRSLRASPRGPVVLERPVVAAAVEQGIALGILHVADP